MKVLAVSDLHFEFHADHGKSFIESLPPADIISLAGDISNAEGIVDALKMFGDKYAQIVFVKGNHELYGSSFEEVEKKLKVFEGTNVHVLENSHITIDGQRFIGCSLWFDWQPDNYLYHSYMNDFSQIKNFARDVYDRNAESKKYLNSNLAAGDFLLIHYFPSEKCILPRWKRNNLNRFFLSDIEKLILDEQPVITHYGHGHDSNEFILGESKMICNPFGYHGYEVNKSFDYNKIVEL